MLLLNPKRHDRSYPDDRSREIMRKTIALFEDRGLKRIKQDDFDRTWYADFLEFVKRERLFATLLTPAAYGAADAAGTPGATASSTRSWPSTACPTGTPGRCRSSGWARSG